MIKHYIESHTDDWYKFRSVGLGDFKGGTGASEVGIILGQSHYRPTLMELFHYKVGTEVRELSDSERMFHGRNQESYIGRLWQCWDGTPTGYVENYNNYMNEVKKVNGEDFLLDDVEDLKLIIESRTKANDFLVRKNERLPAYITHPKHPYLFASLDFISAPNQMAFTSGKRFSAGEVLPFQFPIECKTIDKDAARSLEFSFPDQYVSQLNLQMLLTDSYYGEIAVLSGGNKFEVFSYERNDYICEIIKKRNDDFWENRILPAREYLAQAIANPKKHDYYMGLIQRLEPLPDANPAYRIALSEKHEKELDKINGNQDWYNYLVEYLKVDNDVKVATEKKQLYRNNITKWFVDNKCEVIDFGADGSIKYSLKNGATNKELSTRSFKVKLKK